MFKVGSNQVIRGWDEAVRDMATGEKVFYDFVLSLQFIAFAQATDVPRFFYFLNFQFNFTHHWSAGNRGHRVRLGLRQKGCSRGDLLLHSFLFFSFLFFLSPVISLALSQCYSRTLARARGNARARISIQLPTHPLTPSFTYLLTRTG